MSATGRARAPFWVRRCWSRWLVTMYVYSGSTSRSRTWTPGANRWRTGCSTTTSRNRGSTRRSNKSERTRRRARRGCGHAPLDSPPDGAEDGDAATRAGRGHCAAVARQCSRPLPGVGRDVVGTERYTVPVVQRFADRWEAVHATAVGGWTVYRRVERRPVTDHCVCRTGSRVWS